MKLLVVMGIEAYKEELKKIFFESNVFVFSEMEVAGFKRPEANASRSGNWFSGGSTPVYSTMCIAFTEAENADKVLQAIASFNQNSEVVNPFHGYQLSVEKSI